jgi:histidyl-tRNA synthetase
MSDKKKIYKPKAISGFPEWLPDVRYVEQLWFDHIRATFEGYGYCNIETPSVEELDVIAAKGEDVDKEIYVLERLQSDEDDAKDARLALHFDQTVPLARYVAQHFNDLIFPFKRYQMQRVWRGERPQAGRFREFYQCDIDVINVDQLPLHFDAEMPAIIWETLSSLPGVKKEDIQIRISNRKILFGVLEELGFEDAEETLRLIDKIEKLGTNTVKGHLIPQYLDTKVDALLNVCLIKSRNSDEIEEKFIANKEIDTTNPKIKEGLEELQFVMDQLSHLPEDAIVADLSIVRGLDYYTGTVYETVFKDDPSYGSICSGGRYDDLASNYINKRLPGVGISIGFSRLFDRLRQNGNLPVGKHSPADILVVMPNEDMRGEAMAAAQNLRANGHKVESFHGGKLKRQLAYAEKKGIPYVWFPPFESGAPHEVKNMQSGEQTTADPKEWKAHD